MKNIKYRDPIGYFLCKKASEEQISALQDQDAIQSDKKQTEESSVIEEYDESEAERKKRMSRVKKYAMIAAGLGLFGAGAYLFCRKMAEIKTRKVIEASRQETDKIDLSYEGVERLRRQYPDVYIDTGYGDPLESFYLRGRGFHRSGKPIISIPHDIYQNAPRKIFKHEYGHHIAGESRPGDDDYIKEIARSKTNLDILGVFNPRRKTDLFGNKTLVGLEEEAWDNTDVPPGDALQEAALDTYRQHAFNRSMHIYRSLATAGSIGSGLYAYGLYNRKPRRKRGKNNKTEP